MSARELVLPGVQRRRCNAREREADALDVVAPMHMHVPLCLLAAQRGVDILCQKPLATSLVEAKNLSRAIHGKVRLMGTRTGAFAHITATSELA